MKKLIFILTFLFLLPLFGKERFTINIVQYEVSKNKCSIEDRVVGYITKKAGYSCAQFMGRLNLTVGAQEEIEIFDFLKKEFYVTVQGKKDSLVDVRVRIPKEMDAIFSPVIGGSFVVGYDVDASKKKGVMFLIYIV